MIGAALLGSGVGAGIGAFDPTEGVLTAGELALIRQVTCLAS